MPELEAKITIDFDIFCSDCGNDLKENISIDKHNNIYIDICPNCIDKKDAYIDELDNHIFELQEQIAILEDRLNEFEDRINNIEA